MKKLIITSIYCLSITATFAQAQKTIIPPPGVGGNSTIPIYKEKDGSYRAISNQNESMSCSCCKKEISGTTIGEDVKHTQSCCKKGGSILAAIPVSHLLNQDLTIIGKTDEGLVIENKEGIRVLMSIDNTMKLLDPKVKIAQTAKPIDDGRRPGGHFYRIIGKTDNGTAVWAGPDGKGGCIIDPRTGKANPLKGQFPN